MECLFVPPRRQQYMIYSISHLKINDCVGFEEYGECMKPIGQYGLVWDLVIHMNPKMLKANSFFLSKNDMIRHYIVTQLYLLYRLETN
jgi:hypothetical protein